MIQDLVEVLDRNWAALIGEAGVDFALHCLPFHEQLERDARTSLLLSDLRREERESFDKLTRATAEARAQFGSIVDTLAATAPTVFNPTPTNEYDYDDSLDGIRRRLTVPRGRDQPDPPGRETDGDDRVSEALAILKGVAERAKSDEALEQLREIERGLEHAERTRRTFFRTSAASALTRIEVDLGDLHPPTINPGLRAELGRVARTRKRPIGRIIERVFGGHGQVVANESEDRAMNEYLARMRSDMAHVYNEIRRRLGAERSLLAVFERYRQRCHWYEADRLRELATRGRGKPEDRLTETLAAYLFDNGLNPLTRPMAGQVQPDLLDPSARFSFYVEAKQYDRAERQYLVDGMQQVWDMLGQLRGTPFDVAEAFYVVFRRGRPRYSFPARIQSGDRVVHVIEVDIAATEHRGSNAPQAVTIAVDELLPSPAAETRASRPRGKGRRRT